MVRAPRERSSRRSLAGERWEPRARETLQESARAVAEHEPQRPGLGSGASGAALFLAYYGLAFEDAGAEARAAELLKRAGEGHYGRPDGIGLYAGACGIGWAAEHLTTFGPARPAPRQDEFPLDREIARRLADGSRRFPYDLTRGLCGLAVYALGRLPRSSAAESLEHIVSRLEESAEPGRPGLTWLSPPEFLPPHERALAPRGHWNVGVAHGVPGVIAVLARVVAAGIAQGRAEPLLDGAVTWLLAQERDGEGDRYPAWVARENAQPPARTGWCYGDAGVAGALFGAARAVDRLDWEERALDLARDVARRSAEACRIAEGGVCHGAFGLAHIFLRLYRATADAEFYDAARRWIEHALALRERALALREPGEGGTDALAGAKDGSLEACPHDLLSGAAGIGLVLTGALSDIEPAWDRLLLLDAPA